MPLWSPARPGGAACGRRVLIALALAAALLPGRPTGVRADRPPGRPNVLVLLLDALRADHLGCYGYARDTSPALDSLAAGGVIFESAVAQASWTKPSIPSLFTGLYPIQHRVFTGDTRDTADRITSDALDQEHQTLAEALRSAGYATGAFVENVQISSFLGFDQGFDVYEENLGDARRIAERLLRWLDGGGGRPFFAYVHFLDPHWPYSPPDPYHVMFPGPEGAAVDFNNLNWKSFERGIEKGEIDLGPADLEAMQCFYDGEIRYTDAAISRILGFLRDRGLFENTIIVVTADHGEEFMEHGRVGHGHSLHDELLRVPLILRWPGGRAARATGQVELVDVMPTLLDLVGTASPETAGRSLRPLLEGGELEPRDAFADHRPGGSAGEIQQSLRTGRYKLIRTFRGLEGNAKPQWRPPVIRKGEWLEVEVALDGGTLLALEVEPEEDLKEVRISGQIESPDEKGFTLIGLPCRLRSGVKFKTSSGDRLQNVDLREGTWVQVKGDWEKDGTFLVSRIKFLEDAADFRQEIEAPVRELVYEGDEKLLLRFEGCEMVADGDTDFAGDWPLMETMTDSEAEEPAAVPREGPNRILLEVELYDLLEDPVEQRNIADRNPDLVEELSARLDAWEERYGRDAASPSVVLDREALERLRSLGYIR